MNQTELFDEEPAALPPVRLPPIQYRKIGFSEFKITRLNDAALPDVPMTAPEDVVEFLRNSLPQSPLYRPDVENFIVISLNVRVKLIGFEVISQGTLDTLLVHPREVFKSAIIANAAAIILAHNHPSGDPSPSTADIKVTSDLRAAGKTMKIEITDHLILGRVNCPSPKGYASLRELGYFH